jgi:hypothetical protein
VDLGHVDEIVNDVGVLVRYVFLGQGPIDYRNQRGVELSSVGEKVVVLSA